MQLVNPSQGHVLLHLLHENTYFLISAGSAFLRVFFFFFESVVKYIEPHFEPCFLLDNAAQIAEQRKARIQELKIWCHANCVSQWSGWSSCNSR